VAAVQYTFTHKQYTEQHKTNNTQNNTNILEQCRPCPVFGSYTLAFALQLREKQGEKKTCQGNRRVPAGMMKIHKHTIRIHRHNNKNYINYSIKLEYNHICTDIKKQNLKNMK